MSRVSSTSNPRDGSLNATAALASQSTNYAGHLSSDCWSLSNYGSRSSMNRNCEDSPEGSSNGNVPSFEGNNSHQELSSNSSSNDFDHRRRRRILFCQPSINLIRGKGVPNSQESSTSDHELNSLLEEAISEK